MSTLLLANVGNRDVTLRGGKIEPARTMGLEILGRLNEHKGDLATPLLTPAVKELLSWHKEIEIVLYATDQPEGTPVKYRETDTIYLAKIAKALLEHPNGPKGVKKVWVKPMQTNPSLYDDALVYFRDQLNPNKNKWVRDVDACYAYPVGGTPAANMGLLLAAIEAFEERCKTLYLPQGETKPVRMDLGEQIRKGVARRLARELLNDRAFGSAARLLREAGSPEWAINIAQYAAYRYHFDFDAAADRLESAKFACRNDQTARALCERMRQDLLGLRDRDESSLLRELCHNAGLAFERGEYAAFLGLMFRFQEAVLRYMVERLYPGIDTDVHDEETRDRYLAQLELHPPLLDYLKRQRYKDKPLEYKKIDRAVLEHIVRCAWEVPGSAADSTLVEMCKPALEMLQRFNCLSTLRNKSIIAHGFEGVSRERILEEYRRGGSDADPIHDMFKVLQALGIAAGASPFEQVVQYLTSELDGQQ